MELRRPNYGTGVVHRWYENKNVGRSRKFIRCKAQMCDGVVLDHLCRGVGSRDGISVLSTRVVLDLGVGAGIGPEL